MSRLLTTADDERKAMKDEYVSVEHFLLALVKEPGKSPTAQILKRFGVTQEKLREAACQSRKS